MTLATADFTGNDKNDWGGQREGAGRPRVRFSFNEQGWIIEEQIIGATGFPTHAWELTNVQPDYVEFQRVDKNGQTHILTIAKSSFWHG
jgi:hypothetical protein